MAAQQDDDEIVVPKAVLRTEEYTEWLVDATLPTLPLQTTQIRYEEYGEIAQGDLVSVFRARLVDEDEHAAIKKVEVDPWYTTREVDVMRMLNHCNVVKLKYFYYTASLEGKKIRNLLMEYVPMTVSSAARQYWDFGKSIPMPYVKLWMYQVFRGLAYVHSLGISHRCVHPGNILVDDRLGVVKVCGFGSAKRLVIGGKHRPFTGAELYRAPELLLRADHYTCSIDVWSAGCVLAELILGRPMFGVDDSDDPLDGILSLLGTPSPEQVKAMNAKYDGTFEQVRIAPKPLGSEFPPDIPPVFLELCAELLKYDPTERLTPLSTCAHAFFGELREEGKTLPDGTPLPPLFNFTAEEEQRAGALIADLMPQWSSKNIEEDP